ncbi:Glycosyltransferase involved in cell wall bisynthesis [Streptomyces sp. DvalAA-14]|uniref:glycosyltransferase family 4 protein n=1 Tax=unclassified Streptomyces TaxID=2593676 RepID=UPI00081B815A|nr:MULTISPECIES: glycosyltransferase family 4 protein [unclassified Streptomyces]MYS25036.1 glycosyltransferase [Streptomyces sp. SID4948]SCE51563.1 Glycosyltransferase involved in cell wall bisynthesis [Streptomyces sp. DvalAA-14]
MTQPAVDPAPRDILFVANEVNELGGVARWQAQMAGLFAARGHRVTVIGIAPPEVPMDLGANPPFDAVTLYDVRPPARWRPRSLLGRANLGARRQESARDRGVRRSTEKLSALFRAAGPGAMIIVTQVWAMEWVELADTAGHPVIGMSHESYEYSRQSSRFQRVEKYYRDVDRLVLLTQEDADLWAGRGLNNVGFMPNPLPMMPEVPSPRTEKVVASVGRLSHQKGIDMLLDAWAEAAPRVPGWRLRITGAGELEGSLKRQCTELGLDDSVEWAGQTNDVPGALRAASVFVQSSRGEGFPLALLEAMACGLPCAAFDCAPGVHEIIEDGVDGLLARPGNTSELARQLVRLMNDGDERDRMGELARRNVQRYTPESITRRWEELFAFLER